MHCARVTRCLLAKACDSAKCMQQLKCDEQMIVMVDNILSGDASPPLVDGLSAQCSFGGAVPQRHRHDGCDHDKSHPVYHLTWMATVEVPHDLRCLDEQPHVVQPV